MDKLLNSLSPEKQQAMLVGPAIPPPHGVLPNYENPPNSRHVGWIVSLLGITLSTLSVSLRMYSKVVHRSYRTGEPTNIETQGCLTFIREYLLYLSTSTSGLL
ncbi:hypothetical protein BU23DRAFT_639205 [Bimuria novae-zelandiae CBS 107.79]|uniref:Uncharacterized protein n=1 Tax=Bimuria novae-zelandiae CBS 107.79 TaxID=1447943 RepID=A0A6A5VAT6_9PLEO|nr:hypothetical protein BU23DRAFT_639205 [Bimuria novae-zelandiae CBS 107.79]